jgi:hypothetical protein
MMRGVLMALRQRDKLLCALPQDREGAGALALQPRQQIVSAFGQDAARLQWSTVQ